ncbi:hypothetical protein UFOVP45_133 [uncultured Caudovirales phage]|uniref:Uncharacterized protein n=1 Tax=uncultured Caudovirales phage TaxID=2100421 RepID=A0A6J5KS22_9CAUD|nr:hypothetical protein UFOVP45_133 [uncultured Caudovirales phage]
MSPEEFASHPYAVFHTSHLPESQVLDVDSRSKFGSKGIHLGTEQAALERHNVTAAMSNQAPGRTMDARMHTFWHKPESPWTVDHPISDDQANSHETFDFVKNPYYKNTGEDAGSLSLLAVDSSKLKKHSDYVREAISAGKEDEIHPMTRARYDAGALDSHFQPISDTWAKTDPRHVPYQPTLMEETTKSAANWSKTRMIKPEKSTRGPNAQRIREQLRKDGQ